MANKIQFLRGPQSGIDALSLGYGQPAFTDAGKLYIGNSDGTTKTLINGDKETLIPYDKAATVTGTAELGYQISATVSSEFSLKEGAIVALSLPSSITLTSKAETTLKVNNLEEILVVAKNTNVFLKATVYLFIFLRDPSQGNGVWSLLNDSQTFGTLTSAEVKAGTDTDGKAVSAKTLNDWLTADGNNVLKSGAYAETGTAPGQIPVLGADGKLPTSLLGDDLLGNVKFQGTWDAATNDPELPAEPTADDNGHYYIVSTAGTFASIDFNVGDWIIAAGTEWKKVDNTDAVSSVAGLTGVITLDQLKAAGLEGAIEAGTADQYLNGKKAWTDFGTSTRATVLTGFVTTSTAAVEATDTVLTALGKLQGQSALHAPLASPDFTGIPTAPTAEASTNNNQIATTKFVKSQGYLTADSTIDGGTF